MEDNYIKLLVDGCLKLKANESLFISYDKINNDFIEKLVQYAKNKGINDIYLDVTNAFQIHDILKNSSLKEIKENKLFDSHIWDEYAKKKAAFLMITSEIPDLMNDVDSDKVALKSKISLETKPLYREYQGKNVIKWCIAALPNKYWAEYLFKNSKDPVLKFWNVLKDLCMLENDPVKNWQKYLKSQEQYKEKLNKLEISKLYYTNSLGTDLEVTIPKNALWQNASEGDIMVNIPSYEIFTTPDYHYTNGIVYSSKPLIYTGKVIDEFYLKFKDGKVVDYKAKKGEDILKEILESEKGMKYLGEAALVNYNSPISQSKICFNTTLLDENASCHLALGMGFLECIKDGLKLEEDELDNLGINRCQNHVDFMIGTKDMQIDAETKDSRITIMKDGNLII